jgi:alpha-L-fucosidase
LHVFNWPTSGTLTVTGFSEPIKRAYLLTAPRTALTTKAGADGLTMQVPAAAPDPVASVIVIEK